VFLYFIKKNITKTIEIGIHTFGKFTTQPAEKAARSTFKTSVEFGKNCKKTRRKKWIK
jgi:hypothetical protein